MNNLWCAVNTQPRKELYAKQNLEKQGFEVFLPATQRAIRHARKIEQRLVAYFPGYLFVRWDEDRWYSINGTRGVRWIVTTGDRPAIAPNGLVEQLKSQMDLNGLLRQDFPLSPGDRVRVDRGPFADFFGQVESLCGSDRALVLLDLMTISKSIELRRDELMPTDETLLQTDDPQNP